VNYVFLSIIALVTYALVAPLVKIATREIPPEIAVVITNVILVLMAIGWAKYQGKDFLPYLSLVKPMGLLVLSGILLGVGIVAYYLAISAGPISVVVPIYGLFIVLSAIVGVFFLGEALTLTRVLGLLCAVLSIYLVTR
jgi:transporter family protein